MKANMNPDNIILIFANFKDCTKIGRLKTNFLYYILNRKYFIYKI
jgi:hypothetical protein